MKKQFFIFLLSFILLTVAKCRKDPINPIDELPPETQTGANTFGCLVNGQIFKPGGSNLSGPNLSAIYQYLYPGSPNGYIFAVNAADKKDPCNITQIGFTFDSLTITTGTFFLKAMQKGQGGAGYQLLRCSFPIKELLTTNQIGGQLILKKFDLTSQIASGTFWFTAVNPNGDTVKITDGRFDVRYTR